MIESNLDPPTEKLGLFKRFMFFVTPKKYHRFLTPEFFIAWNASSWVSNMQWVGILAIPWDVIGPIVKIYWAKILAGSVSFAKLAKEALLDFWAVLNAGT